MFDDFLDKFINFDLYELFISKRGKKLKIRKGRYGRFLSCSSYPECKFTFNPEFRDQEQIFCPECGKLLIINTGKDGKFVGCTGFPECIFIFDLRD